MQQNKDAQKSEQEVSKLRSKEKLAPSPEEIVKLQEELQAERARRIRLEGELEVARARIRQLRGRPRRGDDLILA